MLRPLALLRDIGLGYLRMGQPATELQRPSRGETLYVLDGPTTGLHSADVYRQMVQLLALADADNIVVL